MKKTIESLTKFERGYIEAALWVIDERAPSGDYSNSGRINELFPQIDSQDIDKMIADCVKFQEENKTLLAQAGDDSQNGHDFYLTRNGHGCGFWERGYDNEAEGSTLSVGDLLTEKCNEFGESDLYFGDDKKLYLYP